MIVDTWINTFIENDLLTETAQKEAAHTHSGKLSASMLFQPLRFQVLKTIGVPRKPLDAYTISKLQRGDSVEAWFVSYLKKSGVLIEQQKFIEYRRAIGYADAIVNSDALWFKKGSMPHEIKSVTNAKLRRIQKEGVDWHYKIQGALYALGEGSEYFAIDIVSAEAPCNLTVCIFETREMKHEVDEIIDKYEAAMEAWNKNRVLPKFEPNPKVAWTANLQYALFEPEWATESDEWALKHIEALGLL